MLLWIRGIHGGAKQSAKEPGEIQWSLLRLLIGLKYLGLMVDPILGSQMMWHCDTCQSICHTR